jgi:hypothetical protein
MQKVCVVHTGPFHEQIGVVVTIDESMHEAGGPIAVYMRHAPEELFLVENSPGEIQAVKDAERGIPYPSKAVWCPRTIYFDPQDIAVLVNVASPVLVGTRRNPEPQTYLKTGTKRVHKDKKVSPTHEHLELNLQ